MIITGDCLEVMKDMPDDSVDSIITDPPYGLKFMGKKWDYEVPSVEIWQECLRVLKPGGTALIFAGSRTQHRMAINVEDAGFELFDCIMWIYGSGFPKSLNIGKAIDKMQGNERDVIGVAREGRSDELNWGMKPNGKISKGSSGWDGHGTQLKPAYEPIICARKSCERTYAENALEYGVAGLNIDGGRIGYSDGDDSLQKGLDRAKTPRANIKGGNLCSYGGRTEIIPSGMTSKGRFPANIIHDGSDEVVGLFPNTGNNFRENKGHVLGIFGNGKQTTGHGQNDSGSAARFFYCAKASKAERDMGCEDLVEKERVDYGGFHSEKGLIENHRNPENRLPAKNNHPTVKPLKLMEYLCTLTKTPTGGMVLDPFAGSGTTGIACKNTGREFVGIEKIPEYAEIARKRIASTDKQPGLFTAQRNLIA